MNDIRFAGWLPALIVAAFAIVAPADEPVIRLISEPQARHVLIGPAQGSPVDDYAMRVLAESLERKTGFAFARHAVPPDDTTPCIYVGRRADVDTLQPRQYVARSHGQNIHLYGHGMHGNLAAVTLFVDRVLGRKWYTFQDQRQFDRDASFAVEPFEHRARFAFDHRVAAKATLFEYEYGANMGMENRVRRYPDRYPPGVVDELYNPMFVHTLFRYIPPYPGNEKAAPGQEDVGYFDAHPEYFTLAADGKRVSGRQLCFGSRALRDELTRQILRHISIIGERMLVTVDANDVPGAFCHCAPCKAMAEQYHSLGGPIYDYLFELCELLAEQHPQTRVKTLAYRHSQTQTPPTLPKGMDFPDNLIVMFANVEDMLNADWTDDVNRRTYEDLKAWRKLTPHVQAWYYPNCYGPVAHNMPFANLRRIATDLRLMVDADIEGVFFEFTTPQVSRGDNFLPLQMYVYYQLLRDINADVDQLVATFTDHRYGPAAPTVRRYLTELEHGRLAAPKTLDLTPNAPIDFDGVFAYLSPENLHRWQNYFDAMLGDASLTGVHRDNVARLRRGLDLACLARWLELTEAYPDAFSDHTLLTARLDPPPPGARTLMNNAELRIQTKGHRKPLPEPFASMDASRVHRIMPLNHARGSGAKQRLDSDAAFGRAVTIDKPDAPLTFGVYDTVNKKHLIESVAIPADEISVGGYRIYHVGEARVVPGTILWTSSLSWLTSAAVGDALYEPGEDNLYDFYISLKFAGPDYTQHPDGAGVMCDQVIAVRAE